MNNSQLVEAMLILEEALVTEVIKSSNEKNKKQQKNAIYKWEMDKKTTIKQRSLEVVYKNIMHRLKMDGKFDYETVIESKINRL